MILKEIINGIKTKKETLIYANTINKFAEIYAVVSMQIIKNVCEEHSMKKIIIKKTDSDFSISGEKIKGNFHEVSAKDIAKVTKEWLAWEGITSIEINEISDSECELNFI